MCHDAPTDGHLGQHRTLEKIAQRFWWAGLRGDVRRYVASCTTCQMRKTPPNQKKAELHQIPPPRSPFEVIGIDHLGPFPISEDGNRHIIVAIDYLTKWVEVHVVPDTSATHLVSFVNNHLVLRHGTPRMIISDRGTSFMSRDFKDVLRNYGIEHAAASPYHPQTNGLVERTNRTLSDILAAFVNSSHKNWDQYTDTAAFALNTSRQETTSQSPFELVYGRLPTLPEETAMNTTWTRRARDYECDFSGRLHEARERARLAILHKQSHLTQRLRTGSSGPSFNSGDLVLLRSHLRRPQRSEKLLPRYCGPFKISRQLGPVTYRLEELRTLPHRGRHRTLTAHVSQLKLYVARDDYVGSVRDGQSLGGGRL